ncbi:hypothetical protein N9L06_01480 [Mariniblastus sp.]|nr:hypothetical protein [Mariniblastus sp.]
MISLRHDPSNDVPPFKPDIDLEGIGLAAIVIAERARQGIISPIKVRVELIQLVNDQLSRAKERRREQ